MRSRHIVILGLLSLLGAPAGALERLETDTLLDQCATHEEALTSVATASCRAYIHGFIGGSFAVQSAQSADAKPQSEFMRRAQQTRVGDAKLGYGRNERSGYCIPSETNLSEIVARVNRYAATSKQKPKWANEFLPAALKTSFPCKP